MKAHKQNRPADHDFIKELDQLQNLVMKNFCFRRIGFGPFEHAGNFFSIKITEVVADQHLDFRAIGVNSSGGKLGCGAWMTDLQAALVAAGFDAVENVKG